jgi:hypothetical protein
VKSGTVGTVSATDFAEYTATLNYNVTSGTKYWIVIYIADASANPLLVGYNTAGGYANGIFKTYDYNGFSYSWVTVTGDAYFKVNVVATPTVNFDLNISAKKYYK